MHTFPDIAKQDESGVAATSGIQAYYRNGTCDRQQCSGMLPVVLDSEPPNTDPLTGNVTVLGNWHQATGGTGGHFVGAYFLHDNDRRQGYKFITFKATLPEAGVLKISIPPSDHLCIIDQLTRSTPSPHPKTHATAPTPNSLLFGLW